MNNGQDKPLVDPDVQDAYRALPDEKAPEPLNRTILDMAAGKTNSGRQPFFSNWMKPVTWAATIGLSLAIVMEVSQLPSATDARKEIPAVNAPQPAAATSEFESEARKAEQDAKAFSAARSDFDDAATLSRQNTVTEDEAPEALVPSNVEAKRLRESRSASQGGRPADVPAPARALDENHAAESQVAVNQAADNYAAESPEPESALIAKRLGSAESADLEEIVTTGNRMEAIVMAVFACEDQQREAADSWIDCIEAIRESGDASTADEEFARFALTFPEEAAEFEANK